MGCPLTKLESLKGRNNIAWVILVIARVSAGMITEEEVKIVENKT